MLKETFAFLCVYIFPPDALRSIVPVQPRALYEVFYICTTNPFVQLCLHPQPRPLPSRRLFNLVYDLPACPLCTLVYNTPSPPPPPPPPPPNPAHLHPPSPHSSRPFCFASSVTPPFSTLCSPLPVFTHSPSVHCLAGLPLFQRVSTPPPSVPACLYPSSFCSTLSLTLLLLFHCVSTLLSLCSSVSLPLLPLFQRVSTPPPSVPACLYPSSLCSTVSLPFLPLFQRVSTPPPSVPPCLYPSSLCSTVSLPLLSLCSCESTPPPSVPPCLYPSSCCSNLSLPSSPSV